MKIAILTWTHTSNFGTALQAYALQAYLKKLGHEVVLIDYNGECRKINYRQLIQRKIRNCKFRIKRILSGYSDSERTDNIKKFLHQNIQFTKPITTVHAFIQLNDDYDCFICGSDQIWNPMGCDEQYFLKFANNDKLKVAYAPSFGVSHISPYENDYYGELLSGFNLLTVREEAGASIIESITGFRPQIVVDPVFLIPSSEWSKYASSDCGNNYVYTFLLSKNVNHLNAAKSYAKKNHLPLRYVVLDAFSTKDSLSTEVNSVSDFLGYIENASVVFTDSFHVAAFSLIFNKQVYIFRRFSDKNEKSQNSRVETLTRLFKIESHLLKNGVDDFLSCDDIDYNIVNKLMIAEINKSKALLREVLNDA